MFMSNRCFLIVLISSCFILNGICLSQDKETFLKKENRNLENAVTKEYSNSNNFNSKTANNTNKKDNKSFFSKSKSSNKQYNKNIKYNKHKKSIASNKLDYKYKFTTTESYYMSSIYNKNYKVSISCSKFNCLNGNCVDSKTCVCNKGYTTSNKGLNKENINDKRYYCNYQMKDQLLAFLLESILILGFGHLYLGRLAYGLFKMTLICFFVGLDIINFYRSNKLNKDNELNKVHNNKILDRNYYFYFNILVYSGLTVFHLVDIVLMGLNKYPDGNGISLYFSLD